MLNVRRCAGLLLFFAWAVFARAHDPGLSTAQGAWSEGRLELAIGFAPMDAEQLLPREARASGRWTAAEFARAEPLLAVMAGRLWEVNAGGKGVAPREANVRLAAGDNLGFFAVYEVPAGARVSLRATQLRSLPPGHRQFVTIIGPGGGTLARKLISANDAELEFSTSPPTTIPVGAGRTMAGKSAEGPEGFLGFLALGIAHIWTGYDHLLFLFALLVVCRSFRSIVAIISCFTLAHSLTLVLATLEVVTLPSRLVEPAIAASIVFVGAENLWRGGEEPRGRWALTFAFGLIHGFGFASVLRELGVGANGRGIALPLVTFNLGVEIGQIAIAGLVLPLVWWLRKREGFVRRWVPALSAIVTVAGVYWLLERTVL